MDKGLALTVDFGQKVMRAADIHRRAQLAGAILPGKFIAIHRHAALEPQALGALQQLHGHGIQHLVADDHAFHGFGQHVHPAHQMLVFGQRQLLARAQRAGQVDDGVAARQSVLRGQLVQNLQRQRTGSGTEFPQILGLRFVALRATGTPPIDQNRRNLRRRHKVATRLRHGAELGRFIGVIAQSRSIERQLHESVEGQPAAHGGNFLGNARLQGAR